MLPLTKLNSKWIKNLIRLETFELSRGKYREKLQTMRIVKVFLKRTITTQEIVVITDK